MIEVDITKKGKVNSYSTRDYVYQVLKENIVKLKLEPGVNISEKEIAEKLGVSRTPVREAFVMLNQEELLEVFPQKGTFVSLIDEHHVEEARFIREHLEVATVKLACQNFPEEMIQHLENNLILQKRSVELKNYEDFFELDEEFHRSIAFGTKRNRVWNVIQLMKTHLNRVRLLSLAAKFNWETILFQHGEIIKGIKMKDSVLAVSMMEQHLKLVTVDKEEIKKDYPKYFKV